jgi:hypothetical protein
VHAQPSSSRPSAVVFGVGGDENNNNNKLLLLLPFYACCIATPVCAFS